MKISSITIRGFANFSHDENLALNIGPLGKMNILIGPNNAGKSNIVRFLFRFAAWAKNRAWTFKQNDIVEQQCWNYEWSVDADLKFLKDDDTIQVNELKNSGHDLPAALADGAGTLHLKVKIENRQGYINPTIYDENKVGQPLYSNTVPNQANAREPVFNVAAAEISEPALNFVQQIGESFMFFDQIRALDRTGGRSQMESGSELVSRMKKLSQDTPRSIEWERFSGDLKDRLNRIITPLGLRSIDRITPKEGNILHLAYDNPSLVTDINDIGQGFSQLVIVLANLILRKGNFTIICLEEPESSLHPGLLRRFIDELRTFKNVQFLVTTHSHVILDCLEPADKVFRLQQRQDGSCNVQPCHAIQEQHALLDALGIRASSLLQTNCVIWVEGPTDRLYLRRMIKCINPNLKEGKNYTFNFYGGTILSHFELMADDELTKDLIAMLCISRYAIVLKWWVVIYMLREVSTGLFTMVCSLQEFMILMGPVFLVRSLLQSIIRVWSSDTTMMLQVMSMHLWRLPSRNPVQG